MDFSDKGTASQFHDSMRCDAFERLSSDAPIAQAQV